MESTCKYCNELENKQEKPALECINCKKLVHLTCLKRQGTPGDFAGDVFFVFTCLECSDTGSEIFVRNRVPWVNVVLLTIHHLNIQAHGISHHGFFHYKTHIASFIDRNWNQLLGSRVKQKKNWMGTIAGTLSVYNGLIFRSGSLMLGETGWWKLQHLFSPALASYILAETAKDKKGRPRGQGGLDRALFYTKIRTLGFIDYVVVENDALITNEPIAKKPRLHSENQSETEGLSEPSGQCASDVELRSEPESMILDESYACLASKNSYPEVDNFFGNYDFDFQSTCALPEDVCSSSERTTSAAQEDSDSRSSHRHLDTYSEDNDEKPTRPRAPPPAADGAPAANKADVTVRKQSLFSSLPNSTDMPWSEKRSEKTKVSEQLVPLTEYEEVQLLKQVEGLMATVRDVDVKAYLCRLRAKLALRRLKRHRRLPVFDLDETVKVLGGYVTEDTKLVTDVERVLDRFQRSYLLDSLTGTITQASSGTSMLPHIEASPLRSPYSATILKPYIRRDCDTQPLWLRLTDELLRKTNRHVIGYEPPARASIDYSYVRPQHIPALNALCAQYFWQGIDLTESLQHPEFSCVVTYRRLVVGCAFLVPDVGGEAYLSFLLTRPEWRNARIATFMLYHLLQTCTGKDVTLHVSPTNPAIFLYQKFGFKVEELIQDFYEKYYDIDHKGCRHALFLRLVR